MEPEEVEPEEIEYEDYDSRSEQIGSCYNAMSAIDSLDTALMNKTQEAMVKRIRRRCLRIIDFHINDMYKELFDEEDDD